MFTRLCTDAHRRYGHADVQLPLQSRRELQHFLNSYFDCFHRHLPILHFPLLQVSSSPSPLIYAMCSIGALYRFDRVKAQRLFSFSDHILQTPPTTKFHDEQSASSIKPGALWAMQARILLLLYATLSGDMDTLKSGLDKIGTFITVRIPLSARLLEYMSS